MQKTSSQTDIKITAGAFFLLALMLLILPLPWVTAALAAAGFHELCHIAAALLLGGEIRSMEISAVGARIEMLPLPRSRQLLCALAGPAGSLYLILFHRCCPRLAVCGAVQGIYNLIPLLPLDGGRIAKYLTELLLKPKWAKRVLRCIEYSVILAMILLGIYAVIRMGTGIFLLAGTIILIKKVSQSKKSCKRTFLRLQ